MKILQFNVAHGRGDDRSPDCIRWLGPLGLAAGGLLKNLRLIRKGKQEILDRLDAIGDLGRYEGNDIICLNEADFDCTWSHRINMVDYLAKKCGLEHTQSGHRVNVRLPGFVIRHGPAILSRYPMDGVYRRSSTNRWLIG